MRKKDGGGVSSCVLSFNGKSCRDGMRFLNKYILSLHRFFECSYFVVLKTCHHPPCGFLSHQCPLPAHQTWPWVYLETLGKSTTLPSYDECTGVTFHFPYIDSSTFRLPHQMSLLSFQTDTSCLLHLWKQKKNRWECPLSPKETGNTLST